MIEGGAPDILNCWSYSLVSIVTRLEDPPIVNDFLTKSERIVGLVDWKSISSPLSLPIRVVLPTVLLPTNRILGMYVFCMWLLWLQVICEQNMIINSQPDNFIELLKLV